MESKLSRNPWKIGCPWIPTIKKSIITKIRSIVRNISSIMCHQKEKTLLRKLKRIYRNWKVKKTKVSRKAIKYKSLMAIIISKLKRRNSAVSRTSNLANKKKISSSAVSRKIRPKIKLPKKGVLKSVLSMKVNVKDYVMIL